MTREELIEAIAKDAGIPLEKAEAAAESFFTRLPDEQISEIFTELINE